MALRRFFTEKPQDHIGEQPSSTNERGFTRATVLAAGGGAWSKLVTCLRCGAAILIDPRDEESATTLHLKWHDQEQAVEIAHAADVSADVPVQADPVVGMGEPGYAPEGS